jgi:hypothetical protein
VSIQYERGYLILANNNDSVDYLACARALAKSLRWHMPDCKICLLTNDNETDTVFDIIKPYPYSLKGGWHDDWQALEATPFRETIKLEADMLITGNINHWWNWFEHRDVVVSTGIRNYQNQLSDSRAYRGLFDDNELPDVYNSITYWRRSKMAYEFFRLVKQFFENWIEVRKILKYCDTVPANTDMIYAMAAKHIGVEQVTLPGNWPNMIHMKSAINYLKTDAYPWVDEFVWEFIEGKIRINTIEQQWPFHYHYKKFAHIAEEHYDKLLASS